MEANAVEATTSVRVDVQAQIFEAVASAGLLTGSIRALAQQFGIAPAGIQACLDGLVRAGWVTVRTDPDGLCRIRLEQ